MKIRLIRTFEIFVINFADQYIARLLLADGQDVLTLTGQPERAPGESSAAGCGLLVSSAPPTGWTHLGDWLEAN
jgi:hypothetical protein